MAWRRALVALVVLEAACTTSPSGQVPNPTGTSSANPATSSFTSTSVAPTPTPAAAPGSQGSYGVVFGSGPGGIVITVVGTDAGIHGEAHPRYRSGNEEFPPTVSTSNDAVYYLDGDSSLMRLQPGGAPAHLRDLPGTASVRVSFAVSPDDKRIAIAELTYGPAPTGPGASAPNYLGMKLYVEDLDGSHHVDLFASPTVAEWPVGWHGSDLVIAVGLGADVPGGSLVPYPYFAFGGIHLVDAATGVRKATLCGGLPAIGLATPQGLLCAKGNGIGPTTVTPVPMTDSDWSGKETAIGLNCIFGALQPSGSDIACDTGTGGELSIGGSKRPLPAPSVGPDPFTPLCWVGDDHLLLKSPYTGPVLFDIGTGAMQPIDTLADWTVGAIPGGL